MESSEMMFKIIIIGNSSAGKTKIIDRYLKNNFEDNSIPTLGFQMNKKEFQIEQDKITVQIWDTAGQEKFNSLTSSYYKNAKGALVVYDITDKGSFNKIEKLVDDLKNGSDKNIYIILVGNKNDLEEQRVITKEEGEDLSKKLNLGFCEVSAKTGDGIENAFQKLINEVHRIFKNEFKSDTNVEITVPQKIEKEKTIIKKRKCC